MKKILLLTFLCPIIALSQALNGTYHIGTSQPTPYNNIQNAITHINTVGVNGPVVFKLLNNQSITSTIVINSFAGSSAVNTLTIEPAANQNITIMATNPNGYTGIAAVFKINGGDNIIINGSHNNTSTKNLTLLNNNNVSYLSQTIVWIASNGNNPATNIQVKNTILKHSNRNQPGLWLSGVFSGDNQSTNNSNLSAQMASSNNSETQIINNKLVNMRQGIHINSNNNNARITHVLIKGNELITGIDNQKPDLGIHINNVRYFSIEDNIIDGIRSNTTSSANMFGIRIENGLDFTISGNQILNFLHPTNHIIGTAVNIQGSHTRNVTITRNIIRHIKNTGGGIVRAIDINIDNGFNTNTLISNNFISDVSSTGTTTNNGNGLYISNGRDIQIYHNTIMMNSPQNNWHAALYIANGSRLHVVNNILNNTSTSGTRYAMYSSVGKNAYNTLDYNNYYSTQHIGFLSGNRTTFNNWTAATEQDENSLNLIPNFVSPTDLHLTEDNAELDNKGTFLESVTVDIDLETRNTATPDIGADEFAAIKCSTTSVWNGSSWNNGTPNENTKAIINAHYTTEVHGSLIACELVVNEGVEVVISEHDYFKIETNVDVQGHLTIKDTGSLVQVDDESFSMGEITVLRKTTPMKALDYTYWSSPVEGWKLNELSPNTSASKYYKFNSTHGNWAVINGGNQVMNPAKGYIVRAPNGWSLNNATNGVYTGTFQGVPNNGIIPVEVAKGISNSSLIGNPYPSAIDIDKFILDPANAAIFDGTIYLWTHNTSISSSIPGNDVYNYTADDYATYNLTGGIKTASFAVTGGNAPTGKIASGQAFFIEIKMALPNGMYEGVFNNDMRVVEQNNQFFRTAQESSTATVEKNRLWLHITNTDGAYHEMLLGYVEGATNGIDYGFDGKHLEGGNFVNIYSIVDDTNLSIQGKALPFESTEVIPIGYKTSINGMLSIGIEQRDGIFHHQTVYLHDKATGMSYDITNTPYQFETTQGTFDNRFELRFTTETLSIESPTSNENSLIVMSLHNQLKVTSSSKPIESIYVFDVTGKQLVSFDAINSQRFNSNTLPIQPQILLVKVLYDDQQIVTKKVVF